MLAPTINYALKSEVSIMLCFQLCSTHYIVLQMCKKLLCLNPVAKESAGKKPEGNRNACSNNQSSSAKWGGHYTSFAAMLHCYTGSQMNNSVRNTLCIVSEKNWDKSWLGTMEIWGILPKNITPISVSHSVYNCLTILVSTAKPKYAFRLINPINPSNKLEWNMKTSWIFY